jgi:hypothetical protein
MQTLFFTLESANSTDNLWLSSGIRVQVNQRVDEEEEETGTMEANTRIILISSKELDPYPLGTLVEEWLT